MSSVDPVVLAHIRDQVIRPTLAAAGLGGPSAEALILGTGIQESKLFLRQQIGGGPALGLWEMEPATFHGIMTDYLPSRPALMAAVKATTGGADPTPDMLRDNDALACLMARLKYHPAHPPLPAARDIAGQANYWKQFYNTPLGKGTTAEFIANVGAAAWAALWPEG